MPVGFLSDGQIRAYTAFEELPSLSDLEKFFFLPRRSDRRHQGQSNAEYPLSLCVVARLVSQGRLYTPRG
ncbi:hypothetical protein [Nonomuraea jabiensis]|uniref:hypothetical protein n=1 Tax=Nonomuraea jabiensis TaxID=882448 RepID=UPI0036C87BDF